MPSTPPNQFPAPTSPLPRIAVVVSRFNASITDRLLEGAERAYKARGGDPDQLVVLDVPGAFELPVLAAGLARRFDIHGVVALGCIIKGETSHDRHIATAVAQGLTTIAIETGKPVAFGVLTVKTPAQARERAGGKSGNKGTDAMEAVLDACIRAEQVRQCPWGGSLRVLGLTGHDKASGEGG